MSISIETLKEAINIKESIQKLEARLSQILGGNLNIFESAPKKRGRGPGKLSAAARAKIAAAQKARWAKAKGGDGTAPAAKVKKARKGRKLSAEGRAKIIAAQKARWAKAKKQ